MGCQLRSVAMELVNKKTLTTWSELREWFRKFIAGGYSKRMIDIELNHSMQIYRKDPEFIAALGEYVA